MAHFVLVYCAAHVLLIAPAAIAFTFYNRRARWWEIVLPTVSASILAWTSTYSAKPLDSVVFLHFAVVVLELNYVVLTVAHCAQWKRSQSPGWALLLILYTGCTAGASTLLKRSPIHATRGVGGVYDSTLK